MNTFVSITNKKTWQALNLYFINKLQFEQTLQTRADNQGNKISVARLSYFIF